MDARQRVSRTAAPWLLTLGVALALGALAGCDRKAEAPPPPPADARALPKARPAAGADDPYAGVTPMEQRVAVLGLLNKRNGLVRDITLKPGESIRIGRAVIRLRACERTAQWESPPETGAFIQLVVLDYGQNQWRRIFSGWLFMERPDRNVIQHPIYDVFVKSCTMSWPGEVAVRIDPPAADRPAAAPRPSSAPQSPADAPAAPAPETDAPPAPAPAATPSTPDTEE